MVLNHREGVYDHGAEHWYTKLLLGFLKAIDLSENLVKVNHATSTIPNGMVSWIMLPFAALITAGFGLLAYYFDLWASWQAISPLAAAITQSLPLLGISLTWVMFSLTLLPTAAEMLGSRFARFDIVPIQIVTWVLVVVDLLTNIPTITELFIPYQGVFYAEGMNFLRWGLGYLAYGILWTSALFVSSYFLEVVTVLLAATTGSLFVKSVVYSVKGFAEAQAHRVGPTPKVVNPARATSRPSSMASDDDDFPRARSGSPPRTTTEPPPPASSRATASSASKREEFFGRS